MGRVDILNDRWHNIPVYILVVAGFIVGCVGVYFLITGLLSYVRSKRDKSRATNVNTPLNIQQRNVSNNRPQPNPLPVTKIYGDPYNPTTYTNTGWSMNNIVGGNKRKRRKRKVTRRK